MKWLERYEILLEDRLNTEQMKKILGKGHNSVRKFRIEMIAELELKGIKLANPMLIPTELFLEHIGKDMEYYEHKMIKEAEIERIKKELNNGK